LVQIWPVVDEDSGSDTRALRASFLDPFVLILKDDGTLLLLKADKSGELEELEFTTDKYLSATLYNDTTNFFDTARFYNKPQSARNFNATMVLLDVNGHFIIHSLPNPLIRVFTCETLHFMPIILGSDVPIPKHWKSRDSLAEVLLADLGDRHDHSPYLIIRNTVGDVTVYQPFGVPTSVGTFRFRKVAVKLAKASSDDDQGSEELPKQPQRASLRSVRDIGGFSAVFSLGTSPAIILKAASSSTQIYSVRAGNIQSFTGYHEASCPHGFAFIDEAGQLCRAQLPQNAFFGISDWIISKVELGQDVSSIAYFERTASYVLATNYLTGFQLPQDDEWHPEWVEEETRLPPQVEQSSLKLLSAGSHKIISKYQFDAAERVTCVKSLSLETSEVTHERKDLIVVGTAITKGENVTSRGNLYLFDIVDVVPEPDVAETDLKLKLIAKEEVKGAVTAVSEVGSQGFILAAQGQKCMVRGLKEDLTILPVAFMDMRYYVKVAKELKGTGMCILGDGFSGLWLVGYSEEPYKLQLLGRDLHDLDVQAADFLPDGKQLYIVSASGNGGLRVLQYDPENPKTERGTKLLQRSTFNTGSLPTTMTLLPRTPVSSDVAGLPSASHMDVDLNFARHQILITTQEGGLALITPLSDQSYRRLSTLQNILMTNLEHPCSLNPRAYRAVETDGVGGLGMIDGSLVLRWQHQSSQHKASMADKIGGTVWDIRSDVESIGGAGHLTRMPQAKIHHLNGHVSFIDLETSHPRPA
jgi:cleavage and polyadenylation specificity factor subunit 1